MRRVHSGSCAMSIVRVFCECGVSIEEETLRPFRTRRKSETKSDNFLASHASLPPTRTPHWRLELHRDTPERRPVARGRDATNTHAGERSRASFPSMSVGGYEGLGLKNGIAAAASLVWCRMTWASRSTAVWMLLPGRRTRAPTVSSHRQSAARERLPPFHLTCARSLAVQPPRGCRRPVASQRR